MYLNAVNNIPLSSEAYENNLLQGALETRDMKVPETCTVYKNEYYQKVLRLFGCSPSPRCIDQ